MGHLDSEQISVNSSAIVNAASFGSRIGAGTIISIFGNGLPVRAGAGSSVDLNGQALPINSQILPPDAPLNLLAEVLPPERIEELKELGELLSGERRRGIEWQVAKRRAGALHR